MKVNAIKEIIRKIILKETGAHYVRIDHIDYYFSMRDDDRYDAVINGQFGYYKKNNEVSNYYDFEIVVNYEDLKISKLSPFIRGYIRRLGEEE